MKIEQIALHNIHLIKPLWVKLNKHLEDGSKYFKEELLARRFESRIEPYIQKGSHAPYLIQVVYEKDTIVGYALASIDGDLVGEIDSIYLEPEFQRQGIGEALVHNMIQFFDENNTVYDKLNVTEGNTSVEHFYEKYGFHTRRYVMYRTK